MLEVRRIREEKERVLNGLIIRNWKEEDLKIIDEIIALDDSRKSTQTENDKVLFELNKYSKEIGQLFKEGKVSEANEMKENVTALKEDIKAAEEKLREIKLDLEALLLKVPNVPHPSIKPGKTDADNEVIQDWPGELPDLPTGAKAHWDLGEQYDILDFALGAKLTGSGFPVYKNKGARLQRALIQYFLDEATKAGYTEYIVPLMVNAASAKATGQLPDKEGQMYHITADDLYMIPTAEVPLTNIFRGVILKEQDFPIRVTGYTPCFRREAGSYGSDVKGLNRVHQFDKIEIVEIAHPERSYDVLKSMVSHVEKILQNLELPYRILRLCGGDVTFASALTFDFEVYAAAQKKWLEVSSVSNFESFQSNRLKLRFKDQNGQTRLAHTLNGSALALARIVASIMENNQTDDGILIPKVLRPYTGFDKIN